MRRVLQIVRREIAQQTPRDLDRLGVIGGDEVDVAADAGVGGGAADFFHRAFLAGDGLNHFRAANEHIGHALDHDDEIHQRGRICRAARARPGDDRDLRHHAGNQHVPKKYLTISGERIEAFLDARPARIVESDHGAAGFKRVIHHVADFFGVNASERPAADGEILAEGRHLPSIHNPSAGDDGVSGESLFLQAEVVAIVRGVQAGFLKCPGLEQRVNAITRGHHALLPAGVQFVLAAAGFGRGPPFSRGLPTMLSVS